MTDAQLVGEGLRLMMLGMGFVVLFLMTLIAAIQAMSWALARYCPVPIPASSPSALAAGQDLTPVIAAALYHHRRLHGDLTGNKK